MSSPAAPAAAFDRAVGPLLGLLDARQSEAVLAFEPDEALTRRIEELSDRGERGRTDGGGAGGTARPTPTPTAS